MATKFVPVGSLDITTNPALLPQETDGKKVVSGAMRRCTNLRLNEEGRARTRYGSTKGSTAISPANFMLESGGYRYEFGGGYIYRNETVLDAGLTDAQWDAVVGSAWNESADNIYATNGTDRKRITSGTAYEWGITPPSSVGGGGNVDYRCTYDWEEAITVLNGTSTKLLECDSATGWTANDLSSTTETVAVDTTNYKEPTGSVKGTWSHGVNLQSEFRLLYDYGSAQDWSSYQQLTIWVKFDYTIGGGVSTATLYLVDSSNNVQEIITESLAKNTWTQLTINTSLITLDKALIQKIGVEVNRDSTHGGIDYLWVDDIVGISTSGSTPVSCVMFTSTYDTTIDTEYIHTWERQTMADEDEEDMTPTIYSYYPQWWWELLGSTTTNTCWVKYTYVRRDSANILIAESNPSSPFQFICNTTKGIGITPSTDSSVTHVRLYRTNFNAEATDEYYLDSEWNINMRTIGVTVLYDNELSTLLETDHNRPPLGNILAGPNYLGYIYMAYGSNLYYCKANQPEYWPVTYFVSVGSPDRDITGLEFWNGNLYAMKKNEIYLIAGTGHGSFLPTIMRAKTGVKQHTMATSIKGAGLMRINYDGIYSFNLTSDEKITAKSLNNIFYGETVENIIYIDETYLTRCFTVEFKNKIYFFYVGYGETYAGNIIVMDMDTKKICHHDYGVEFTAACVDYTNDKLYACDSSGYIWELEAESATTDNGTAIDWQIQSKVFSDTLYKYFPRYAKYDVDVVSGSAYGYILLNEAVKQTHTITGSRNTKARHITGCTGDRLSLRLAGSGVVSIYGAEVE